MKWLGLVGLATLLALSGGGMAQMYQWSQGDVQIMGAHPDLQPGDDGLIHSSGDYFSQIILRGEDASRVEEIGFSFGFGPPSPTHYPGYAGFWDFRTDDTPEDGWFIPLTTTDTPDGEYKFAIHAYESAGNPSTEIARFWGASAVENGQGDSIGPWPWIHPGETAEMSSSVGVQGVAIEFAENATARLWVDGQEVNLTEWTPPAREDDEVPRHTVDSERAVLGSGYKWNGDVDLGTTLRVQATDEAGNQVTKGALVGVGIDAPVIEVRLPDTIEQLEPGTETDLTVEVENFGLRTGNVTLAPLVPDDITARIEPANITLEPGTLEEATLTLEIPEGEQIALEGAEIGAEATYDADGQAVTSTVQNPLDEVTTEPISTTELDEDGLEDGEDAQGTPGAGALALLASILGAAVLLRRR